MVMMFLSRGYFVKESQRSANRWQMLIVRRLQVFVKELHFVGQENDGQQKREGTSRQTDKQTDEKQRAEHKKSTSWNEEK